MKSLHQPFGRLQLTALLVLGGMFIFTPAARSQAPTWVTSPVSQAVTQGGTAVLTITAAGALPITYTWRRNFEFTNFYQATLHSTNCTLVLSNLAPTDACFFNLSMNNANGNSTGRQVVIAVIASGMETNGFVLNVRGLTNSVWRVDCSTNLAGSNWFTLTNLTIPRNPPVSRFVDLAGTNLNRYYRVTYRVTPKVN